MPNATADNAPRFYVFDRQSTRAAGLTNWSAINQRYWVMDRTTGRSVDEAPTKRAARETAALFNDGTFTA